jgi:putative ABC transport system permease protein
MIIIVYTAFLENMLGTIPPESKGDRILGAFRVEFTTDDGNSMSVSHPGYQFLTEYIKIQTLPHIEYASVLSAPPPVEGVYRGRMFKVFRKWTDGNYWNILDFSFLEGRPFTQDDYNNARFVAVINKSIRKKLFGRGEAIGETVTVDGQNFRVIGVVEDVALYRQLPFAEVWVPLTTAKTAAYRTDGVHGVFYGIVLAENREVIPLIKEEYRTRVSRYDYPRYEFYDLASGELQTNFEYMASQISRNFKRQRYEGKTLSSFLATSKLTFQLGLPVLLFILLPTLNLMNINLSRIMERSSEIGVRKAFGASSSHLTRQFLTENIILTFLGGIIGLVLSFAVLRIFDAMQFVPYGLLRFNGWIFLYGFVITLFFGIVSGVYPAWKMSRYHPVEALRRNPL